MVEMLRELMARRPFAPFRVILSSGDAYEVRHPEFAWLVKGGLFVGLPAQSVSNGQVDVPERAVYCSFLHMAGVDQSVET